MIDTIEIESIKLDTFTKEQIENGLKGTSVITTDLETGEIIYNHKNGIITTDKLQGSFDYRISIKLLDYGYKPYINAKGKSCVMKEQYHDDTKRLLIRWSSNKLIQGHNIYGGISNPKKAIMDMLKYIERVFYVPGRLTRDIDSFYINLIDFSCNFKVPLPLNYIRMLKNTVVPYTQDKQISSFGVNTIYIPNSMWTYKIYNKQEEFRKHDYKRIALKNEILAKSLLNKSIDVIRFELSIKKRKLKEDSKNRVKYINESYLIKEWKKMTEKVIKINFDNNKKARVWKTEFVQQRLDEEYSTRKARSLFSTWSLIQTLGETYAKDLLPNSTFNKHIRALKDCNICLNQSDIQIVNDEDNIYTFIPEYEKRIITL